MTLYYLIKIDFGLGNYQFHILKDEYEGGSSVRILTYDGNGEWRHISNYFFPIPNLKTAIKYKQRIERWTYIAESEDLKELGILKNEEYLKYRAMRELVN